MAHLTKLFLNVMFTLPGGGYKKSVTVAVVVFFRRTNQTGVSSAWVEERFPMRQPLFEIARAEVAPCACVYLPAPLITSK